MTTEFNAPAEACTDPRHTGALREQMGCNGLDPANQAIAKPAPGTGQAVPVRSRIKGAVTAEYLRRVEEVVEATAEEHCDALTSAVMAALRTVASEMEQRHWGGNCPHCAAYLTNLTATVQERVGKDACPLCAEYLALKQRAESSEAEGRPLLDPAARTEPTYRERIAAALFEEHIRQPWAMAYPIDTLSYLQDADSFLAIRDGEMTKLRRQAEAASAVTTTTAEVARGFRLVQRNGAVLDGAQFPNGRIVVMEDPDWGLCSGARSLELLLRGGYHGARVEFSDEQPTTREAHVIAERDCLAMAVTFALQWTPDAPMSLRDGIEEILATMPARPEPTTKASEASDG